MTKTKQSDWLQRIEALRPGDLCEFEYPAVAGWHPATVVVNGGSGYWHVKLAHSDSVVAGYIEQVRCPGQTEAWPR